MDIRKKPNIIICTCDQLRAFELGCYGNEVIRTPNIDRLASEGIRFETAVTNSPVCMAARSILLSGQYNRTCTGGIGNVAYRTYPGNHCLPEYPFPGRPHLKDRTLPEVLRERGYHTATIGKWHVHSWPQDVGFDYYLIPRVHHCHTNQHFTENGNPEFIAPGYSVDYEGERAEQFLHDRKNTDQPFFLYYNISPPHCPVSDAPEKYTRMYRPDEIPIRENVDLDIRLPDQEHHFKVYRWDYRYYSFHLPYTEHLPGDCSLRDVIALYYGMTTWVDDTVGRLLSALDATGLANDTILLFTSDHGDNLGSHGLVQKGTPNDEALRIPYILRWPRLGRGNRVIRDQVASLVDTMPTLLSLAGIPTPAHVQGKDLSPVVKGGRTALAEDHAVAELRNWIAIRSPSDTYVLPFREDDRSISGDVGEPCATQFYDMTSDPYQLNNLAETGSRCEVARELAECLRDWDAATPWMVG